MTIQSYTQGPGTLTLGAGPFNASSQMAAFKVECAENVKKTDPQPMLSGEDKLTADKVTLEWTATGKVQQDLLSAGLVTYSWTNAGDEVPFVFIPSTAEGRQVTGTLRLVPITIGGDSGSDPQSDIKWTIIGTPVLEDVA